MQSCLIRIAVFAPCTCGGGHGNAIRKWVKMKYAIIEDIEDFRIGDYLGAKPCLIQGLSHQHPASHTHRQLSEQQLREAGVDPDMIRLSIGLEDPEDIINDIQHAIQQAHTH